MDEYMITGLPEGFYFVQTELGIEIRYDKNIWSPVYDENQNFTGAYQQINEVEN